MSNRHIFDFEISQFRTISRKLHYDISDMNEQAKTHFGYVTLKNLPKDFPTSYNPRTPDIKAKPCRMMIDLLEGPDYYKFTDCNRGLLLIANKIEYSNIDGKKFIHITFELDEEGNPIGGLVDGGHTYAVLNHVRERQDLDLLDLPIPITILEGVDTYITEIARARNTSVQVEDKSIANLDKEFEPIKEALGKYRDRIIYFENENKISDEAVFRIEDLVALMTALNKELYTQGNPPTVAYSGSATCFHKWLNLKNRPTYEKMYGLLPSIVELYEYLYSEYQNYARRNNGVGSKTFGAINGIVTRNKKVKANKNLPQTLPFTRVKVDYALANGFILPIFASLRFLLKLKDGKFEWAQDPKQFLKENGPVLVGKVLEAHSTEYGGNPNKTGKSRVLWQNIESIVYIKYLESLQN